MHLNFKMPSASYGHFLKNTHMTASLDIDLHFTTVRFKHSRLLPICDAFFIQRGHRRSLPI